MVNALSDQSYTPESSIGTYTVVHPLIDDKMREDLPSEISEWWSSGSVCTPTQAVMKVSQSAYMTMNPYYTDQLTVDLPKFIVIFVCHAEQT